MVELNTQAPSTVTWKTSLESQEREFDLQTEYEKGTTVLYFFPGAFTGVCSDSSCELRDSHKDFESLGANLIGISVDLPFSQKEFIKEFKLNYPILSDFNKDLIMKFDIYDDNFVGFKGVAKRSLFVVKNGMIIYKWIANVPSDYPPFDKLKEFLKTN